MKTFPSTRSAIGRIGASALSLTLLLGSANVQAQDKPATETSLQMQYRQAYAAFDAGDLAEARRLFLDLWQKSPTYDVAAALGEVEYKLGEYAASARYVAFAAANAPPMTKPEKVQALKDRVQELKTLVGTLRVAVNQPAAEIIVDGQVVGKTPFADEIFLGVGPHKIEARLGQQTAVEMLDVLAGSTHNLEFALNPNDPSSSASTVAPSPPLSTPARDPGSANTGASWVPVIAGGALTLVGLGVGVGFHLAAASAKDEHEALVDELGSGTCELPTSPSDCDRVLELAESYEQRRNLSTAGFITGGVAAAGTLTYFLIARPDRRSTSESSGLRIDAGATARGGSISLSGKF